MRPRLKNQLDKLKRQKILLVALSLLFVVVIFWVVLSLFISQQRVLVSDELVRLSQPLVPTLNRDLLQTLSATKYYNENQLDSFSIYVWRESRETGGVEIIDIVHGGAVIIEDSLEEEVRTDLENQSTQPLEPNQAGLQAVSATESAQIENTEENFEAESGSVNFLENALREESEQTI